MFGKENKKKELVSNLAEIYGRIEREHQISPGDFPNLKRMQVTGAPGLQDKGQCHMSWPRRRPALDAPMEADPESKGEEMAPCLPFLLNCQWPSRYHIWVWGEHGAPVLPVRQGDP